MNFTTTMTWPAPLSQVLAMLTDPRYVQLKNERMGYVAFEVMSCTQEGAVFAACVRVSDRPRIALPALAQRFVKPDQLLVMDQTDRWDRDTARGRLVLENRSARMVQIAADMALTESAGVTTNTLNWQVSVSIPLVGGKLATLIAEDVRQKAEKTAQISVQLLQEAFSNG